MGSTVQAFNSMMANFLEELHQTFPEETKIAIVQEAFADLSSINARKPMELYTATLTPHQELVMQRNAALFEQPIELPGGLDMSALWSKPDVSEETRAAMWQYIQMLFMLGTTVQNLPPQLLDTIESVAMSCAGQMQEGPDGGLDLSQLSSMLMGGLGSVLGGGGGGANPLAALTGGGANRLTGPPPRTSRPSSKPKRRH